MSDTVIKVENVSKLYRLGEVGTGTLRHDFNRWWHKLRGKEDPYLKIGETNDRTVKGGTDYAWALKDISFEVKRGEVLGIIGRNGAGKSTLLKILSRVTMPTHGEIKIKGRVASLLEVGTGFNPELTGRDNIYLNGVILGMRKREIDRKLDEIVAFSEVERYIDTPVKRYSSGMYVRLAFAVAAHLEPEILIVDEVLAVGDVEFQRKCMGKMHDVSTKDGRTVLFVSHNLSAISSLCQQGVLLHSGQLAMFGAIRPCVDMYLAKSKNGNFAGPVTNKDGYGFMAVSVAKLNHATPLPHDSFSATDPVELVFDCNIPASSSLILGFTLFNSNDVGVMSASSADIGQLLPSGRRRIRIPIPLSRLPSGEYRVEAALWDASTSYAQSDLLAGFSLVNTVANRAGIPPRGSTLLEHPWQIS